MTVSGRAHRMAFNIPLVDFTWCSGAMEMLPGSHHLRRGFPSVSDLPRVYPVRLELRLGDAVLRDCNCLHRGTPNLTDHVRPMLDQTYKRVFAEVDTTATPE
jgi:ectoine hydroxylase-related dioxygenase (phytanoyl-CoA dioxygenase family)